MIIAATGPHRRETLNTLESVVETMKAWLPVWKLERFEDGGVFKENETWALKGEGLEVPKEE